MGMPSVADRLLALLTPNPGTQPSSVLPLQTYAPTPPTMGTDESGRMQQFTAPTLGFGLPNTIRAPLQSMAGSASMLEHGQTPQIADVMPAIMAMVLGGGRMPGFAPEVSLARPGSVAAGHAADMSALYNEALKRAAANQTPLYAKTR